MLVRSTTSEAGVPSKNADVSENVVSEGSALLKLSTSEQYIVSSIALRSCENARFSSSAGV